jgi:glutathione S-transferase
MQDPRLPILYSFRRCPYAMRARLALAASGEHCELREVVLKNKPSDLLAASPKGTVPVLVLPDAAVLEQSLDIMRWALGRNDPLRWLAPEGGTLDGMLALVAACDNRFKPQLDRYKYPGRFADAPAGDARELGAQFLLELEARLANGPGPQLFGARAALADAAVMPFVRQFAMVEPAWFESQPWPLLRAWLAGWTSSPLFERAMHKYAPRAPGEAGAAYPPA